MKDISKSGAKLLNFGSDLGVGEEITLDLPANKLLVGLVKAKIIWAKVEPPTGQFSLAAQVLGVEFI